MVDVRVLCETCRTKHGVTEYLVDCKNCEMLRSCKSWLWNGSLPKEGTEKRANSCKSFISMRSHRAITCERGF